jgi:hypothetical protein
MNRLRKIRSLAVAAAVFALLRSVHGADAPTAMQPAAARPGVEAGPTKVSVGVWATDIAKIDSAEQTFKASLFVGLRWHDPRLAHGEAGVKSYALDDIWHPNLVVANDDGSVKETLPEKAHAAADGTVTYRQRYVGPFMQKLDLRQFPFDSHRFRAHFVALGHRPTEIQFVPNEELVAGGLPQGAGIADVLTMVDWNVDAPTAFTDPYHASPGVEIAGYAFEFQAKRLVQHYLVKVMVPLLLIVMMSWTVFWIDPTNGGTQISVAVTSMLTLIAYRFAVGTEVPRLPYLTRLDAFILASSLLVFCSLIEVMVTTRFATDGKVDLARRIDRRCRFIFPLTFIAVTTTIFAR